MVKYATMPNVTKIHQGKQPVRRHFLGEWLEAKQMTPADLLDGLNDPERFSQLGYVSKSQVYRWLKGQMPNSSMQARIAVALGFEDDPSKFLSSPDIDWMSDFLRDRSEEELKRIKVTLENAFPKSETR